MGKIPVVDGDIFESGADVILHQVNCQGVMGSGVAKQVREKYPNVFATYQELCLGEKDHTSNLLGIAQPVQTDDHTIIINLFAQDNFGYDGNCYTNYDALRTCLETVRKNNSNDSIAIPYLMACHRGGGDWDKVSGMIEEILDGCDVTFYRYVAG